MTEPAPPFAFYMGGEVYHDALNVATLVFGGSATDDGNWPGSLYAEGPLPDDDGDSTLVFPPTHRFVADGDRPAGPGDYPVRICAATGYAGAPHAMVFTAGRWYLRRYAPAEASPRRRSG